jgi:endonuclease III
MGRHRIGEETAFDPIPAARALIERIGSHPWKARGEALEDDQDVGRWLVAACLLSAGRDEGRALEAFQALSESHLDSPGTLASAPAGAAAAALEASGIPQPARLAHQLTRACQALQERHRGSLDALAGESETLEALGGQLAALGPGIGKATILRFLRPLRARWPAAAEVPLTRAAHAAAAHLGWIDASDDPEGDPSALRQALAGPGDGPAFSDVESALERLGRRACVRERADRCPMGAICPLRAAPEGSG